MSDLDLSDHAQASSRATDLIADFHARHEAWRRQGEDLARLRSDARAAASREAATIITNARADIRRIVVDARSALLVLTAQLRVVDEEAGIQIDTSTNEDVPASVLQARRDLQKLLDDIRPELDDVTAQANVFMEIAPPAAPSPPPVAPAAQVLTDDEEAVLAALRPALVESTKFERAPILERAPAAIAPPSAAPSAHTAPAANRPAAINRSSIPAPFNKPWVLAVAAAVALSGVGTGAWWLVGRGSASAKAPVASIPRAPQTAWDDQIPTLTASLVALPSATSGVRSGPSAGVLSLDVEVRRTAWVQSSVDGGVPTTRTFQVGEVVRLTGSRDVALTVRDAGAIVVSINGGPKIPLGPDGQVVTRHFTTDTGSAAR
jgi:hypothetical protein